MPVWYRTKADGMEEISVSKKDLSSEGWRQETDTFDTWFSSGQWAFSTFARHGLANLDTEDHGPFVPSHTMVMGRDILLFWACRMLLLTTYRLNDVPWKNIFFTGLIRDEHGQKMSKSKGNGIEPADIINKYGTDALRVALIVGATPGNDIAISERKIDGYSKFINKLWNAAKFLDLRLAPLGTGHALPKELNLQSSRWLIVQLNQLHRNITEKLDRYDISLAMEELYEFTWKIFCDWYVEIAKVATECGSAAMKKEVYAVAFASFRSLLTMLHPFMPYVTEEIYNKLPHDPAIKSLCLASWSFEFKDPVVSYPDQMDQFQEVITTIRSVKTALNLTAKEMQIAIDTALPEELLLYIRGIGGVEIVNASEIPTEKSLRKPFSKGIVTCTVDDKVAYRQRIEKELANAKNFVVSLTKKLGGSFAQHAAPDVVEKERQRLDETKHIAAQLEQELQQLS